MKKHNWINEVRQKVIEKFPNKKINVEYTTGYDISDNYYKKVLIIISPENREPQKYEEYYNIASVGADILKSIPSEISDDIDFRLSFNIENIK